ncbi:MAG TPA: hypothetical protein VFU76_07365, partial [Terriglobales bacterium]|nr:hypothetical protein [Terriglobales bacterium]
MARTRSFVVVMLLFAATLAAAQTDWNVAQNWSTTTNPGGAWTYGARAGSTSGTFVNYTTYLNPATSFADRDEWTGGGGASAIFHNTVGAGGSIPTNMLVLTPDPTSPGYLSIARWTAPSTGFYVVQGVFSALPQKTSNATVQVMVNSAFARTGFLSSANPAFPFTVYLNVTTANTHVDFVVKSSGSGDDSTGLNVAIHAITPNRSATGAGTVVPFNSLQLTNTTLQAAGSIWTTGQQSLGSGFDTTFTYQINSFGTTPGEGFTFTLQNDPAGPAYLGANGGALGV